MSKKVSLASALNNAAGNKTVVPIEAATNEKKQVASHDSDNTATRKLSVPPSRQGKKAITGFFEPEVSKQLKSIALEEDTTVQQLLNDALNDLFIKKGRAAIA